MIGVLFRRELKGYFATPVAYVFMFIFLALAGFLTFYLGGFFERGQADLQSFFGFHPWLYLFLIPAVSMRLWAEERRTGTIELLMTLPVTMTQAVLGKFLAAWAFAGICLAGTFPIWITVNYLGDPDNGVILASYLGSMLMAGAYLAIGACISALTKNQVIAFVVAVVLCFGFVALGLSGVFTFLQGLLPHGLLSTLRSFSFLEHFESLSKGVLDLRDMVFFASVMALFLFANSVFIEHKKAQ